MAFLLCAAVASEARRRTPQLLKTPDFIRNRGLEPNRVQDLRSGHRRAYSGARGPAFGPCAGVGTPAYFRKGLPGLPGHDHLYGGIAFGGLPCTDLITGECAGRHVATVWDVSNILEPYVIGNKVKVNPLLTPLTLHQN